MSTHKNTGLVVPHPLTGKRSGECCTRFWACAHGTSENQGIQSDSFSHMMRII